MEQGTVLWFDDQRGVGFVRRDAGGEDLLVHYLHIHADGCFRAVGEGQRVEFEVFDGAEGLWAVNVRRVFGEDGFVVTVLCGDAVQVRVSAWGRPNLKKMADRLRSYGDVKVSDYLVRLRAPPHELTVFDDGRAIVKGTGEEAEARRLVSEWLDVRLPA